MVELPKVKASEPLVVVRLMYEFEPSFKAKAEAVLSAMVYKDVPAEVMFNAPAEVKANVPEVAVARVKLAEVVVKLEAAPDARVKAPAEELPIPTAPVDVPVLILVLKLEEALMD